MSKYGFVDEGSGDFAGPRIAVFGVGGGGGNAVEYMVQQGIAGVTFICANTDRQALDGLSVPTKFQLGIRGLGAGGKPEVAKAEAESNEEAICALLNDYDMIFITAGMGGGTGTGAAPVVARLAKEMGKLVIAVVSTPFSYEGTRRHKAAKAGIEELMQYVNSIITVPNEKLEEIYGDMDVDEAFGKSNDILLYGVKGLIDIIRQNGKVNVDFEDVSTVMEARGYAMMGIGRASGDGRARQAAEKAIRSPLLEDLNLKSAKGLLVNVAGSNITLNEAREAATSAGIIADIDGSNLFFGMTKNPELGEYIEVTVIATGLTMEEKSKAPARPVQQPYAQMPTLAPQPQAVQPAVQPQATIAQPQPQVANPQKEEFRVEDYLKNQFK